jgi:hypothetical protein
LIISRTAASERSSVRGRLREAAFRGEIEHLAARHAAETGSPGQGLDQRDADRGVGMGLGARQDVEGESQQAVAGEDRGRLVERLVRGRPAAAQIVIVHCRQVVMDQRIAVHAFERRRRHQRALARHREQGRALDHQERPKPLAAAECCITHRFDETLGSRPLPRHRRAGEQAVEKRFGRGRNLRETSHELGPAVVYRHDKSCVVGRRFRTTGDVQTARLGHGTSDLAGVILPNGFKLQQVPPANGAGHCEPATGWSSISLHYSHLPSGSISLSGAAASGSALNAMISIRHHRRKRRR